jgi:hypothetical protein
MASQLDRFGDFVSQRAAEQYWRDETSRSGWMGPKQLGEALDQWLGMDSPPTRQLASVLDHETGFCGKMTKLEINQLFEGRRLFWMRRRRGILELSVGCSTLSLLFSFCS